MTASLDNDDETTSPALPQDNTNLCTQCQKPASFMCSSCALDGPRYCSLECQKLHWKTTHADVCQATLATRRSRQQAAVAAVNTTDSDTNHSNTNNNTQDDIAMNDLQHVRDSRQPQNDSTVDGDHETEAEFAESLAHYVRQIYFVIQPVVICIILSIFWVKVSFSGSSDYSPTRNSYVTISAPSSSNGDSSSSGGGGASTNSGLSSLANAMIIVAQIIVVTFLIVFLFKRGYMRILKGFFGLVVLLLLGFMTYLLMLNMVQVFSIPLDYITMVFALYNWSLVGLFAVFGPGPLWLQQIYLTVISSLMAFALTGLEEYTTWILLGLLAVWDLVAVLCPFGPLRLLIESSQSQQREVPALLYSVNAVWFMLASSEHMRLSRNLTDNDDGRKRTITQASLQTLSSTEYEASTSSRTPLHIATHQPSVQEEEGQTVHHRSEPTPGVDGFMRLRGSSESVMGSDRASSHGTSTTTAGDAELRRGREDTRRRPSTQEVDEETAEREGLKLGLGDFVFYSVLIARAALYDWITTVCCTIAVLTGLTATIFLLAIYKKALPALPISIAFGVLFYFVAKTVLVPYIGALCVFGMVGL